MLYDLGWDPSPKAAAQFSLPPDLQYYDPARSGHGIDLRRVAGTTDLYFIGFYTYDANGAPEWFTALGRFVDGVFVPARNEFGDSLVRNIYQANQIPRSVVDASAEFEGSIRLDFNQAANSPACLDGNAGRALGGVLAVMSFELPGCRSAAVVPAAGDRARCGHQHQLQQRLVCRPERRRLGPRGAKPARCRQRRHGGGRVLRRCQRQAALGPGGDLELPARPSL
ncbi:MAG: hypothetical protein LKM39_07350 [Chiayiivirga sp.]|jgi:hypothetical protein|nr:hypothetical protein [Chiayiivirga sp.]